MTATPPPPRRAAIRPARAVQPSTVPSGWSAANPVDQPTPAPSATTSRRPPAARPAASRPAAPPVGLGAKRTAETGRPRVDWQAYDAQIYDGPPEWVLYRCWTRVVIDGRWWVRAWQHLVAFVLGRRHRLLWIGISMRAGIARATEHLADKGWRRMIHVFEIDPDVAFDSEAAAEAYENARIAAERPRFNKRGNDAAYNPGATHLTPRFHTRHRADWQQQASLLALAWVAVSAVFTWLLWPADAAGAAGAAGAVRAVMAGVATAAVLMMFWRIIRLAVRGAQPTTGQKARIARRVGS